MNGRETIKAAKNRPRRRATRQGGKSDIVKMSLPSIKIENREHGYKSVGGWKAEVDRMHLSTTFPLWSDRSILGCDGSGPDRGARGLVRKESSMRSCERSRPVDAGGEDDRANGCKALQTRLSKEGANAGHSASQETEIRYDGRRSRSFDCIALTGATEGGLRHEGFTLGSCQDSFLPHWSSERRCLRMQTNVRGGTVSSTSAPPAPKARRVGGQSLERK